MTGTAILADELLALLHRRDPVAASLLGVPGHDDRLPDLSAEADAAAAAAARSVLRRAGAGSPDDDPVTRAVVVQQAEALLAHIDARAVEHVLAFTLTAPAPVLLHSLSLLQPDGDAAEEAFLTRLAAVPAYLSAAADRHRAGIAAGRLPLAHLGRRAVSALDRHLADPAADPLRRAELSPSGTAARDRILRDAVRPAFARYRDVLDREVVGHGRPPERPGLCWLPDGDRSYAALSRAHTTTDRTPDELHRTGWDLLEALEAEYVEVGSRAFGATDVDGVLHRLRTDPGLRWRSGDEVLDAARAAVRRAERAAPAWFHRVPTTGCTVAAVPDEEAAHVTAYYVRPSSDGTRPGTYYANTHRADERERFTAEVVAFHEAAPGHHFQLALAQEAEWLPPLRRTVVINAYVEGWALYAERLADEMGLYSDDVAKLGLLAEDSLRAARLVVDTGLHAQGWSRERAVDVLRAHTLLPEVDVQSEVDRYTEHPGQALSYMVGRLEIERLRARGERELGPRFDPRAFHDVVLAQGSLPMDALAQVVDSWIDRQRHR